MQGEVEHQGGGSSGAKRGGESREYVKFLMEHDPEGTFANLMRVCDKDTGRAIWVTKESAERVTKESAERVTKESAEMIEEVGYEAKAAAEIKRLEEKTMKLEEEIMKLSEALKREKGAGAGGNGAQTNSKLKEDVQRRGSRIMPFAGG